MVYFNFIIIKLSCDFVDWTRYCHKVYTITGKSMIVRLLYFSMTDKYSSATWIVQNPTCPKCCELFVALVSLSCGLDSFWFQSPSWTNQGHRGLLFFLKQSQILFSSSFAEGLLPWPHSAPHNTPELCSFRVKSLSM